jgi:hypothetical protein
MTSEASQASPKSSKRHITSTAHGELSHRMFISINPIALHNAHQIILPILLYYFLGHDGRDAHLQRGATEAQCSTGAIIVPEHAEH